MEKDAFVAQPKNKNEATENPTSSLKRSQAVKTVESNKKVKTDDELKTLTLVENKKELAELIGVPSHIQIPLYPPPKLLNTSTTTAKDYRVKLDFVKRFRKTFDKMTKEDLEEMVLQKVVEAIIHKSEFSEMREVIDKQEKIIAGHRKKLSELTKQFRDLEMVHTRVLKDIESRNSQFIMPMKIMRGVGLQVNIPSTENITEAINSSTQKPPHRSVSPQRPMTSTNISDNFTSLSKRISNNTASSSSSSLLSAIGGNTRRGYVQQIQHQTNVSTSGQRTATLVAANALPKSSQSSALLGRRSSKPLGTNATAPAAASLSYNSINQLSGSNAPVSITSAKPKVIGFIDLTDEDEEPPPAPSMTLPGGDDVTQYNWLTPPLVRVNATTSARARTPLQSPLNSLNKNPPLPYPGMGTANARKGGITQVNVESKSAAISRLKYNHPAPLPPTPPQVFNPAWKLPPPRPTISIKNFDNGIALSWTIEESLEHYDECVKYQIYAYHELVGPPSADSWRHVGDVKAMLLPMTIILKEFQEGKRYYFAVRAMDCHQRYGPFSLPKTWSKTKK